MEQQTEALIKVASLVLGGIGFALMIAYVLVQFPKWTGMKPNELDNKYFVVDYSGALLAIGIACISIGLLIWFGRGLLSRGF